MSGQWAGSTRRSRLPADWPRIRLRILKRDAHRCHVCGGPGADEVDHIQRGDNHSDSNLAAIHHDPCHKAKTAAEAVEARTRPSRTRSPDKHPGLR